MEKLTISPYDLESKSGMGYLRESNTVTQGGFFEKEIPGKGKVLVLSFCDVPVEANYDAQGWFHFFLPYSRMREVLAALYSNPSEVYLSYDLERPVKEWRVCWVCRG